MRDSTAFIPKVRLEETNPTFKHPENWDSLSLQDKAKLIIADQAVKLMELQCHKNTTRHQEDREFTKHGSSLRGRKPRNLGGDANTEVAIPPTQGSENIPNRGLGLPDKKPSDLGGEANTDVAILLTQATTPNPGDTGTTRDLQGHIMVNDELQYLGKGMQKGGERNMDVVIRLN